jgi:phosphotransacetylase
MNRTGTGKYEALLERCRAFEPIPTAVAHPCDESALSAPLQAAAKGLIKPILVGPKAKIAEVATRAGIDLARLKSSMFHTVMRPRRRR